MRRKLWRLGLALVLFGGVATGCHRQAVQSRPPHPDPLLISKKPIEGNPSATREATVRVEPPAPPSPGDEQLASSPARGSTTVSRSVKAP
jgi:hypothetical protein